MTDSELYPMSPRDRMHRDPAFCNLVQVMQAMIHRCQFSPSELREAAVLACVLYEETRTDHRWVKREIGE